MDREDFVDLCRKGDEDMPLLCARQTNCTRPAA